MFDSFMRENGMVQPSFENVKLLVSQGNWLSRLIIILLSISILMQRSPWLSPQQQLSLLTQRNLFTYELKLVSCQSTQYYVQKTT